MRERTLHVRGLDLHLLEWGAPGAPAVLLLHGGSAHARWWEGFAPTVADRFRVLAPDLRGHGDSAWARPPAYGVDDHAADVLALAEQLDLRSLAIVGHSFGGMVAMAAAARLGDGLRALAIVDTRTKSTEIGLRSLQRLAQMPAPRYRTRAEGIARYRLLPIDGQTPPAAVARMAAHALARGTDGLWTYKFDRAALAAVVPHDPGPALAGVRCPILAIRGANSPMMSDRAVAALRAAAPQLAVVTVAAAHHHVMLDQPDEFARVLGEFLRAADQAAVRRDAAP